MNPFDFQMYADIFRVEVSWSEIYFQLVQEKKKVYYSEEVPDKTNVVKC